MANAAGEYFEFQGPRAVRLLLTDELSGLGVPDGRPHPLLISSMGAERFLLPRSDVESSERQIERPLHLSAIPSDGLRSPPNRNM